MKKKLLTAIAVSASVIGSAYSADWTTHNGNNQRAAFANEELKFPLNKAWEYKNTKPMPLFKDTYYKPEHQPTITEDFSPQIISAGNKVFFNSSSEDFVKCVDKTTGKEIWTYYTNAPVRLSPTYAEGKILFSADDGYAYCLDAETGKEIWKYTSVEKQRWCIGNGKFVSQWPSRTGVAVEDGIAYFTSGLFPPYGVFVCAVKVEDGSVVWKKKLDENHSTMFNGHIMIDKDILYIATGDTAPVEFYKASGDLVLDMPFDYRRTGGGCGVLALGDDFIAFGPNYKGVLKFRTTLKEKKRKYKLKMQGSMRGSFTALNADKIALLNDKVYMLRTFKHGPDKRFKNIERKGVKMKTGLFESNLLSFDKKEFIDALNEATFADKFHHPNYGGMWFVGTEDVAALKTVAPIVKCKQSIPNTSLTMQASLNAIIIGGKDIITAYSSETLEKLWEEKVDGEVWNIIIANGVIMASTDTGSVYCFSNTKSETEVHSKISAELQVREKSKKLAKFAVEQTPRKKGYILVLSAGDNADLVYEIAKTTDFYVIGLEADKIKADKAKAELLKSKIYGTEMTIHHTPADKLSEYLSFFANIIISPNDEMLYPKKEIERIQRPFGGIIVAQNNTELPQLKKKDKYFVNSRGHLEGGGEWGYLYADSANTTNSGDIFITGSEFDTTWYGAPGTEKIINRHMVPMGPLSYNGLMFVLAHDYVTAVDNYNGAILWERDVPASSRVFMPLQTSPACVDDKYLYIASEDNLLLIDVLTGKTIKTLKTKDYQAKSPNLPIKKSPNNFDWGYVGYSDDFIIASFQPSKARSGPTTGKQWNWKILHKQIDRKGSTFNHPVVSTQLDVLNKNDLSVKWSRNALIVNSTITIDDDIIYFYETRNPNAVFDENDTLGLDVIREDFYLVALNLKTGALIWEQKFDSKATDVISLCKKDDMLLTVESWYIYNSKEKIKTITDKLKKRKDNLYYRLVSRSAKTGEVNWDITDYNKNTKQPNESNHNVLLMHPTIIMDKIVMRYYGYIGVYNIIDGKKSYINEGRRCSSASASATNLFYRFNYTTTYDMSKMKSSPVTRITRPTCWLSIMPVGGVLLMPEYGSTSCVCGYPLKISIGMEAKR